jgi:dTMP kinase
MNLFAVDGLLPDLVLYLDLEAGDGLSRAQNSSMEEMNYVEGDRIEREGVHFQQKVRAGYRELASRYAELFVTIEISGKSPEEVGDCIYSHVQGRLRDD